MAKRAAIVLALLDGASPVEIATGTGVSYATIRSVRAKFAAGGPDALRTKPPRKRSDAELPLLPKRLRAAVPEQIRNAARDRHARGRLPLVRMAIETWIRDAIATGRVRPGGALPSRRDFRRAFDTTLGVVQRAFATLERQGFVRSRRGGSTDAAPHPPFADRYLYLGMPDGDENGVGILHAVKAAAAAIERSRGVRFEFPGGEGRSLNVDSPWRRDLFAQMRSHRWAGVMFQNWTDEMAAAGKVRMDGVPVCIPGEPGVSARGFTGSMVVRLGAARDAAGRIVEPLDDVFSDCAAAGCRRVAFLNHQNRKKPFRRDHVAGIAARFGLQIGPWHYQEIRMVGDVPGERDAIAAVLAAMLAPGRGWEPDAVVLMDDHWLRPLELVLAGFGGGRMRAMFVSCLANRPALPKSPLNVRFRGVDHERTLLSFVDWCEALRRGAPDPRPPAMVRF